MLVCDSCAVSDSFQFFGSPVVSWFCSVSPDLVNPFPSFLQLVVVWSVGCLAVLQVAFVSYRMATVYQDARAVNQQGLLNSGCRNLSLLRRCIRLAVLGLGNLALLVGL